MPLQPDHIDVQQVSDDSLPVTHFIHVGGILIQKRLERAPMVQIEGDISASIMDLDSAIALLMNVRGKLFPLDDTADFTWYGNHSE